METLLCIAVVLAAVFIAGAVIGALIPVLIAAGIVAIISYVIASATGLPFWGVFIGVAIVGAVGYVVLQIFD
jgi:hypothetical protein